MSSAAIRTDGLGKGYHLGRRDEIPDTFVHAIADTLRRPFRNFRELRRLGSSGGSQQDSWFWALRDISLEVPHGQVVGIIGRNGAGKSTLLKILSRITEPTCGRALIRGRVASLLEIGTGFHPELTGRENVYLNGAILGMRRKEIDGKFDDIVDFAGVARFIDTPVKRYSSGMQVRLGFAVAAHLEPEILLVDEVLAVGDAEFQRKSTGRMRDAARSGRTVLFVSHNMGVVTALCERAVWIDEGIVKLDGVPNTIVSAYLAVGGTDVLRWTRPERLPGGTMRIDSAQVLGDSAVPFDRGIKLLLTYDVAQPVRQGAILVRITDEHGNIIFTTWDTDSTEWRERPRPAGKYESVCTIPPKLLRPGRYTVTVAAVVSNAEIDTFPHLLSFQVSPVGFLLNPNRAGILTPILEWTVRQVID